MTNIVQLSRFFKRLFWVIFYVWPVCLSMIWFQNQNNGWLARFGFSIKNYIGHDHLPVSNPLLWGTQCEGFLLSLIPTGISMLVLYFFIRLLACYERGEIFVMSSVHYLKKIGLWMLIGAAIQPFYQLIVTVVLTIHNPHGQRVMSLTLGVDYFRNVIIAGLIYLVAFILHEAQKMREEQALTV